MGRRGQWRPTRRQVLEGIAAGVAAGMLGCDGEPVGSGSQGGSGRRRVGIVGGGMAGVATAWLLDGAYDVVLFEAADAIGGNARTVEVPVGGRPVPIDIGAQYFHPGAYPKYTRLLEHLGLLGGGTHEAPATITLSRGRDGDPLFVSPVTPDRMWPLREAWNGPGVLAFTVMSRAAVELEQGDGDWQVTVEAWLEGLRLTETQRNDILLPWVASLYSGDVEQARGLSARSALVFLSRTLAEGGLTGASYFTVAEGMGRVLERMVSACETLTVRTGAAVERLEPLEPLEPANLGFRVVTAREALVVDELVLAAPPEAASRLLADLPGTDALRGALAGIERHVARLALHRDPAYAHADERYWSFLNVASDGRHAEASMWLAPMLRPLPDGTPVDVWKSWITHRDRPPAEPLHGAEFRHMLPTPATLRAQEALRALQGAGGPWVVGGWSRPFDAQETALESAMDVAAALAPDSARLAALRSPGRARG